MSGFFTRFSLLTASFFVLSPAFAGSLQIKNCSYKDVKVAAFNNNDKSKTVSISQTTLRVGEIKSLHCKTATCHIKVNAHIFTDTTKSQYHVRWEASSSHPKVQVGHSCRMAVAPQKSTLSIKNCSKSPINVSSYNGSDASRFAPYHTARIQPNEIKSLGCATQRCGLNIGGKWVFLLGLGSYRSSTMSGSIHISRFQDNFHARTGHVCPK